MRKTMLALKLPADIEKRLTDLAKKTGRTKSYYAREAILAYIEDLEDTYLALKVLESPGKVYTMKEVEKMLGLDD
jgi:RHH-type transcriptional regulator, rel operon repressor / antitoxin RelB